MTDESPATRGSFAAIAAFALLGLGCHGFVPVFVQPLLLVAAGLAVLVSASGGLGAAAILGAVPLVVGIWLRQVFAVDLFATGGLMLGLLLWRGSNRDVALPLHALWAVALLQVALASAAGYHLEEALARLGSRACAATLGRPVDLGPVFGGGRALIASLLLLVVWMKPGLRLIAASFAFAMGGLASGVCVAWVADRLPEFGSRAELVPSHSVLAAQLPWIPLAVALLVCALAARLLRPAESGRSPVRFAGALAIATAALVAASGPLDRPRTARRMLIYRPGLSNYQLPQRDLKMVGTYSSGMMGSLPRFGRALGIATDLLDRIEVERLGDYDVLMFVNQRAALPVGVPAAITQWVRGGGHLIVVGDHTAYERDGEHGAFRIFPDEPLEATGIRFPNNSGDHLSFAFRDATVTCALGRSLACVRGNPYSPIIGTGLQVSWPARPVVVGRYGYNDSGVFEIAGPKPKFLGDLQWNTGERLGGVVLMAEQQLGAGRVTVAGDTTGFHNVSRTFVWPHIADLVCARPREGAAFHWVAVLGLTGLGLLGLLRGTLLAPPGPPLVVMLLAAAAVVPAPTAAERLPNADQPLLLLDTAVKPEGKLGEWAPEGHMTLLSTALRLGHLPLFSSSAEHGIPPGTRTLVLSRPQIDPGPTWRGAVLDWVRGGGRLVVAASYEAQPLLGGLFRDLGCAIEPIVHGPQQTRVGTRDGEFLVRLRESWNLRLLEGTWQQLVYSAKSVSLAQRPFGRGTVVVITDRTFLQNFNQEGDGGNFPDNIRFTMWLLGQGRELGG